MTQKSTVLSCIAGEAWNHAQEFLSCAKRASHMRSSAWICVWTCSVTSSVVQVDCHLIQVSYGPRHNRTAVTSSGWLPNGLFYNRGRECLLRGTNWFFKSESYIFVLKRLKQNLVRFKVITLVTTKKSAFFGTRCRNLSASLSNRLPQFSAQTIAKK